VSERRVSDAEVARCCNDDMKADPPTGRGSIITALARDLRQSRAALAESEESLCASRSTVAHGTRLVQAAEGRVRELEAALRCEGTSTGQHEWRAGEYDGHARGHWCCRCARDARDIVDGILASAPESGAGARSFVTGPPNNIASREP
jgi:hypothetical protein